MTTDSLCQWSPTTCERLSALSLYLGLQEAERDQTDSTLKAAKKDRDEASVHLFTALREVEGEFKDGSWPPEVSKRIIGLHQDLNRREHVVRTLDSTKKRHAEEVGRATSTILTIIADARDSNGLFDHGDAGAKPPYYESVMLTDIVEETPAKSFAQQSIITVGDFLAAAADGRLEALITSKDIGPRQMKRVHEAVTTYTTARGINLGHPMTLPADAEPSGDAPTDTDVPAGGAIAEQPAEPPPTEVEATPKAEGDAQAPSAERATRRRKPSLVKSEADAQAAAAGPAPEQPV